MSVESSLDQKVLKDILDTRERFIMSALDRHSMEIEQMRVLLSDLKREIAELKDKCGS